MKIPLNHHQEPTSCWLEFHETRESQVDEVAGWFCRRSLASETDGHCSLSRLQTWTWRSSSSQCCCCLLLLYLPQDVDWRWTLHVYTFWCISACSSDPITSTWPCCCSCCSCVCCQPSSPSWDTDRHSIVDRSGKGAIYLILHHQNCLLL